MKYYLVSFLILCACGSSNEPTDTSSSAWKDYCQSKVIGGVATDTKCYNLIEWKCDDGIDSLVVEPAQASNFIGTVCMQDAQHTSYYKCALNDKGEAIVYCDNTNNRNCSSDPEANQIGLFCTYPLNNIWTCCNGSVICEPNGKCN